MTHHPREAPQFFMSAPHPCPYLPGRTERKIFTNLIGRNASNLHDTLARNGFRRSQTICYKPACENCRACVSVRIPVSGFSLNRSQRRVMDKNGDLIGEMRPAVPTSEQFSLFRYYVDTRHPEGGMTDMTMLDYVQMVEDTNVETAMVEYRRKDVNSPVSGRSHGDLLAVALTDLLSDGLSMVYAFYDTDQMKRGLGTLMILDHIARVKMLGLSYLYLGYWVKGSPQMDYKGNFRPLEVLDGTIWRPL